METQEIQLDKLFSRRDKIQVDMNNILSQCIVSKYDLSRLPPEEFAKWDKLRMESNKIADRICKIILNK